MIAPGRVDDAVIAAMPRLRPAAPDRTRPDRLRLARAARRPAAPDWGAIAAGLGRAMVALGCPPR